MAWTSDAIYPMSMCALRMTNGKVYMIFNLDSRSWYRGSKIEPLCGIVRTGDANVSDSI